VQPDLCVICDISKLDDRGCNGAPDWIIEILSQSTAHKDLNEKFELYRHAGVQEYWVVHPAEGTVLPYRLDADGQYALPRSTPYTIGDKVPVGLFPGFEVELGAVFG
jgi:Uma2 family endonuclease